jgi:NADPH:quinone reductase-like Zn-dependent oxidoreductase
MEYIMVMRSVCLIDHTDLYDIGDNLPASLLKDLHISDLLNNSNLRMVAKFLELQAFKVPNLSILTCGKASGILSIPILGALNSTTADEISFSKYEYTDSTFDLAEMAKERIPRWSEIITRGELDLELDLAKQDCIMESYDVIIIFQHPKMEIIRNSLVNAHKLLKPRGKVILVGQPRTSVVASIMQALFPAMGSPPGLNAEARISESDWTNMLLEIGYSQNIDAHHSSDKREQTATFLTAVPKECTPAKYPDVLIIGGSSSLMASAALLQQNFSTFNIDAEIVVFDQAKPNRDQVCIVLSDAKDQILIDTTENQWNVLKEILLQSGGVFWVTQGANISSTDPNGSLISGMLRTVRSENGGIPLLTVDLDAARPLDESKSIGVITSVFKRHFKVGTELGSVEHEYSERGGVLMIPRLFEDKDLVQFMSKSVEEPEPELQPFRQPGRPLYMQVGTPGLLDSIHFVDDDRFSEELPSDWVQMEVKVTGFNFKDVMTALGQITLKSLGWEASGVVTAIGKKISHVQVGDRVLSYGAGLFSTDYRGPAQTFHKIPDHLSFERAASLPVTYATAYYSCYNLARLQKGESVLVHAASGGLGQAIIELCLMIGVDVYATVGTADKKEFLMRHFHIPEDHIFFSRDGSFAKGVMRMTHGKGVDVIMNSLAGENLRLTWDCIAPWGRFVELGQRDIMINTRLEMKPLRKNTTFSGFLLDSLFEQRPEIASDVIAKVIALFGSEKIRGPAQIHSYPISEVEKALRTMQTGGHMGKLVAVNKPGDMVRVVPRDNSKTLLDPGSSYMLVGGLGGIGRETAIWMIEHGATNLILINRSGLRTEEARKTVEAIRSRGVSVAVYSCDITDAAMVERTVAQAAREMPPIKGLIQGAMLLRVGCSPSPEVHHSNSSRIVCSKPWGWQTSKQSYSQRFMVCIYPSCMKLSHQVCWIC